LQQFACAALYAGLEHSLIDLVQEYCATHNH
jgi:hypothetical protein